MFGGKKSYILHKILLCVTKKSALHWKHGYEEFASYYMREEIKKYTL